MRNVLPVAIAVLVAACPPAAPARARDFPFGEFTGPEQTLPTLDGHVLIHYTREGGDAVDDEFLGWGRESLEFAWPELIDRLGWKEPPPDGGLGGDDRYDVYLMSFGDPANRSPNVFNRGVTIPDPERRGVSHIIVNSDIRPGAPPAWHPLNLVYTERTVRSVFGHELVHACQMSYRPVLEGFFSENSATYHQVDLYGILESTQPGDVLLVQALLHLRLGLPAFSVFTLVPLVAYSPTWSKYMVDSRGGDRTVPRRIYEEMTTDTYRGLFEATDRVLRETGGDLATDFQTYAEWNYKMGPYADGTGYEGAERFPTLWGSVNVTFEHGPAPIEGVSEAHSPRPLASNYIRFAPNPASRDGVLRFSGLGGVKWGLSLLARDPKTATYEITRRFLAPEEPAETSIVVPDWNEKNDLVAVVSNLTFTGLLDGPAGTYRYTIEALPGRANGGSSGSGCAITPGASAGSAAPLLLLVALLGRARLWIPRGRTGGLSIEASGKRPGPYGRASDAPSCGIRPPITSCPHDEVHLRVKNMEQAKQLID